ncbi:MAG: hypothetical protein GQ570_08395 [Helicobacteraceae bacterium]|nr:hypothetical protein [Helicobacteraceae bacterium]
MDVVPVEENKEVEGIKLHFGISDEMFPKGVCFASLVADGKNRTESFEEAFDVEKKVARSKAGEFFKRKWVQELIRYFVPDEGTLYIGDISDIVKVGMQMITDDRRDDRVRIEAIKALQPYIKQQTLKTEAELLIKHEVSAGETVMEKMNKAIGTLGKEGKMIDESGAIIDVELVH